MAQKKYKEIQEAHGTHPIMGAVVYWNFTQAVIDAEKLESEFAKFGINHKFRVKGDRAAFTKALGKIRNPGSGVLVRKISGSDEDDGSDVTYAVVIEKKDSKKKRLRYRQEATVTFDRENKTISFEEGSEPEAVGQIEKWFKEFKGIYDSKDMNNLVKRVIRNHGGFMLREQGGVYFVPLTKLNVVDKLEKLVEENFPASHITFIPTIDSAKSKGKIGREFHREMKSKIKQAEEDLADLVETRTKVRASSLNLRLDRYKEMRHQMKMYSEVLEADSCALLKKVRALDKKVLEILDGDD